MWNWIVFSFLTLFLIYISRASLRAPRSHGFYRFFAWEFMLALFLINEKIWFQNPFAWYQLIAWTLLFASLIPLAFGVRALKSRGKPSTERGSDPTLLAFEKTAQLYKRRLQIHSPSALQFITFADVGYFLQKLFGGRNCPCNRRHSFSGFHRESR
ncbi:MAG: hypothetical protein Q8L41_02055 [Anaerolineales bacterium]|nr:hypothetical protein [Anaerolineales bacterium]